MTVLWNGRGCAGGMIRGGYTALMGGVEMGCCAPISTFRSIRATTLGFRYVLYFIRAISMGPLHDRCGRCGELRTVEQVGAPPRHGRTERREARSEARSLLQRGARTSLCTCKQNST